MSHVSYDNLIVTGSIAYDEIMDFPGKFIDHIQPDKLHQLNVSFVVDNLEKQMGGIATNISYNASLLTQKPISILSAVGKDGKEFFDFYQKNHINTEGLWIDKEIYTATGKVITDQTDNQIWGFYYGAGASGKHIDFSKYLTSTSLMIISSNHPDAFFHAQRQAIDLKAHYMYDPGMALSVLNDDDLKTGVDHATFLIGNDYEIAAICKRLSITVQKCLDKGIIVITTLGEKGVLYESSTERLHVPAYTIEKPLDPTGAGDAWRGGFMSGLVEGKSIEDCLKQGNALASFAVEKYGTVNHSPSLDQIMERFSALKVNNSVSFI